MKYFLFSVVLCVGITGCQCISRHDSLLEKLFQSGFKEIPCEIHGARSFFHPDIRVIEACKLLEIEPKQIRPAGQEQTSEPEHADKRSYEVPGAELRSGWQRSTCIIDLTGSKGSIFGPDTTGAVSVSLLCPKPPPDCSRLPIAYCGKRFPHHDEFTIFIDKKGEMRAGRNANGARVSVSSIGNSVKEGIPIAIGADWDAPFSVIYPLARELERIALRKSYFLCTDSTETQHLFLPFYLGNYSFQSMYPRKLLKVKLRNGTISINGFDNSWIMFINQLLQLDESSGAVEVLVSPTAVLQDVIHVLSAVCDSGRDCHLLIPEE